MSGTDPGLPRGAEPLSPADRRRAMVGLFSAAALAATGYIPAFSVAPLAAEDMLGAATWSGLPGALIIAGLAVGATLLSAIMARYHRGFGLLVGFALAAAASLLAALATGTNNLPFFLAAMLLFGIGYASRHLARFAAGELCPATRRSTAIGIVVWAGTVGAVVGPLLLAPSQRLATGFGLEGFSGPYLLAASTSGLAWLCLLLLLPARHLPFGDDQDSREARAPRPLLELMAMPRVCFALAALVIGQFVMAIIMAMTPVHIRHAGEGLGTVGLVFSVHTFGMFALSPLTGMLADRWGRIPVILCGEAMLLAAALLAAPTHGGEKLLLVCSLGLLGIGWNFGFVAGSALLSESVAPADRLRVQGAADTVVWSTAAFASLISGVLMELAGYGVLNLIGATLSLLPPTIALGYGRRLAA